MQADSATRPLFFCTGPRTGAAHRLFYVRYSPPAANLARAKGASCSRGVPTMAARAIARRCSSAASSSSPRRVSIVYGTFCNGSSKLDAQTIAASAAASRVRFRVNVEDGAAF